MAREIKVHLLPSEPEVLTEEKSEHRVDFV